MMLSLRFFLCIPLVIVAFSGCGASSTSQIGAFENAAATTEAALKLLDANNDNSIDEQELAGSPGLQSGAARIDRDGDQRLTREELLARFEALNSMSDLVGVQVTVVRSGRPLANAKVSLTPAAFLGEGLQSYEGVSNARGGVLLTGKTLQLPGLPTGYYTAHIVHEKASIDSQLGCEISDDASGSRLLLKL